MRRGAKLLVGGGLLVTCVGMALLCVDVSVAAWLRRISIGRDTTRLVSPIDGHGGVDFVRAINVRYSKGVTPRNNAAVMFLHSAGDVCLGPASVRPRILRLLGMPPHLEVENRFRRLLQFQGSGRLPFKESESGTRWEAVYRQIRQSPWTKQQHPERAEWISLNRIAFARAIQASHYRRLFVPLVRLPAASPLAKIGYAEEVKFARGFREVYEAVIISGMYSLADGHVVDAERKIISAHRAARLLGQLPFLWSRRIGLSLDMMACQADKAVATSSNLTDVHASRYMRELKAIGPPLPPFSAVGIAERYEKINEIMFYARHPIRTSEALGLPSWAGLLQVLNYNRALIECNRWFDKAQVAYEARPYLHRLQLLENIDRASGSCSCGERPWSTFWHRKRFFASLLPENTAMEAFEYQASLACWSLDLTAFSLAAYHASQGAFPRKLGQLVPGFIRKLPSDPFTHGPLVYRKTPTGYQLQCKLPVGFRPDEAENPSVRSLPRKFCILYGTAPR